jgi:GNAT superfamily N-acetyltransferase
VAHAGLFIWHGEANQHIANMQIYVTPAVRRRGVASRLLAPVAEAAAGAGRSLLQAGTTSASPDGDAFLTRIGARMVQEESMSTLELAEVDQDAMRLWLERGADLKDEFELAFWEDKYPRDQLEAIARLREVISNSMPWDAAEHEEDIVTVERVLEWEASLFAQHRVRWTAYVRERTTGRFAGYTEVVWQAERPEWVWQWDTGVVPGYRNLGIGRWLKAAMIEKLLRDRPAARRIRTGNSTTNASMLRINRELGFKPSLSSYLWQVAVAQVQAYLATR